MIEPWMDKVVGSVVAGCVGLMTFIHRKTDNRITKVEDKSNSNRCDIAQINGRIKNIEKNTDKLLEIALKKDK